MTSDRTTAYEVRADNGLHGYANDRDEAHDLARNLMGRPDVLSVVATPLRSKDQVFTDIDATGELEDSLVDAARGLVEKHDYTLSDLLGVLEATLYPDA